MERPHDKNGIPVYPGDVLRTFHYASRRQRRKMYLYHVVREVEQGILEAVPARELAVIPDGGRFRPTTKNLGDSEIVQGYGPGEADDFTDRPRRKGNGDNV